MTTEILVDDETRAALLLFNERLDAQRAQERAQKRVAKAERAKDEAAARVRKLADDPKASSEDREEAEAAYKAAAAEFTRIQENPDVEPDKPKRQPKAEATSDAHAAEASDDESAGVESADEPTEISADEETSAAGAITSDESDEAE